MDLERFLVPSAPVVDGLSGARKSAPFSRFRAKELGRRHLKAAGEAAGWLWWADGCGLGLSGPILVGRS